MVDWEILKQKRILLPKINNGKINMSFCALNVLRHFTENVVDLVYPEKTIFVSLCYSYWISNILNCNILDILSDPNLFFDDPFFVPYEDYTVDYTKLNPTIKDITIDAYKFILNRDLSYLMSLKNTTVEVTYKYFKQEFDLK